MSDGGTQYDLKLGLDTGAAKPEVHNLGAELVRTGEAADRVQDKLNSVASAATKTGNVSRGAAQSVASVASSSDRAASSLARTDSNLAKATGSSGRLASAASSAGASIAKTTTSSDGLNTSVAKTTTSVGKATGELDKYALAALRGESSIARAASATDRLTGSSTRAGTALTSEAGAANVASAATDRVAASTAKADSSLLKIGKTLAATVLAWFSLSQGIAAASDVVTTFSSYEDSLVSVSKTTGLLGSDLKSFYGDVVSLSTSTVPIATRDLLDMGAAAGSLGVSGSANILNYSSTIGKLTAASEDLKGAEAATILTQMMNVQGEGPENVDELASVLIRLGLATASTERGIALVALEVSKATAPFKLGTTVAAAYGAAMAEMKIEAQLGGSAIGRTFREIQTAVTEGGAALDKFAKVAGVSSDEFKKIFEADPNQGVLLFLKGLATYGRNAGVVLERLGLSGDELAKVLPSLGENYERLAGHIRAAQDEQQKGTALNDKAALAFDATSSDLTRLRNAYDAVKVSIGEGVSPAIRQVTSDLTEFAISSREGAHSFGEELIPVIHLAGETLLFLAENIDVAKAALMAFLILKAIVWFTSFVGAVWRAIESLRVYIGTTVAATGTTAALGTQVQRTSVILDQYGKNIIVTEAATKGATAAGSGFLSLAITPLAIGLTVLLGVLLYVNDKIVEFSERTQREMAAIIQVNQEFAASIAGLREDTKNLLDDATKAQEVQKRLLEGGIKPGRSAKDDEAAERVRQQVDADFQRRRVGLLYEHKTALEENQKAAAGYASELEDLRKKEKELTDEIAAQTAKRNQGIGQGRGAGVVVANEAKDKIDAAETSLGRVRARMEEVQNASNMANAKVKVLTTTTSELTTATEGYTAPAEKAARSVDDLGGKADKTAQRFEKLRTQIELSTAANHEIAAAYARSTAEGRRAEQQAEANARVAQAAGDFEGQYRTQIEDRTRSQIAAERQAVGSKTLAGLRDQVAAAEKLAQAYASGLAPAVEEAKREQDLLNQKLTNASGAAEDQVGEIEDLTTRLDELNRSNAFASQAGQMEEMNRVLGDSAEKWDGTTASIERANVVMQINNTINQAIIGHTDDEAEAIARLIRERERLNAVFQARMRLGRLEEEVRRTKELSQVKRDDFLTEREYERALAAVNTEHEVRSALLSVEFNRLQALTALKRQDFATEQEYLAEKARLEAEFDDNATRTEAAVRAQAALNEQTKEYVSLMRIVAKAGNEAWSAVKDSLKDAITQALKEGKVDWESLWGSLTDRLLSIFLDMLEEMLQRWIATQAAMAAAQASAQAAGGVAGGVAGGAGGGGGMGAGMWAGVGKWAWGKMLGNPMTGGNSFMGGAGSGFMTAAIFAAVAAIVINQIKTSGRSHARTQIDFGGSNGIGIGLPPGGAWNGNGGAHNTMQTLRGAQEIIKQVTRFIEALGGDIDRLSTATSTLTVGKVGQGKKSRWYVVYADGLVKNFGRDMEAAMEFALVQAIRQTPTRGLSPEVVQALKSTTAEKMDQLQKDIDTAMSAVRARLGQTGSQVFDTVRGYQEQIRAARELGISTDALVAARDREIAAIRNQMLGIDTSTSDFLASLLSFQAGIDESTGLMQTQAEEQLRNAQQRLDELLASGPTSREGRDGRVHTQTQEQWEEAVARLRESITRYTAELDRIPRKLSDQELSMAIFDSLFKYLEGSGKYAEQAHKYALLKVELEFESIRLQLVALGKWEEFAQMFSDAYAAARAAAGQNGGRRGGGRNRGDERKDFVAELDDIIRGALPEGVAAVMDLGDRLDEMTKKARELKVSEEKLAAARQALIDQQKEAILDPVREYLRPEEGGTFGLSQWEAASSDIERRFDEARAANAALLEETGQRAIAFWRLNAAEIRALNAVAEEAIDSLGLPMEEAADRVKALRDTIEFLRDMVEKGALSADRFAEVMGQISDQAEAELLSIGLGLLETIGMNEESAEWVKTKAALEEANFDLQVAQMQFLFQQYVAMGLIAGEAKDRIEALLGIITDPKNRPNFQDPGRYQRNSRDRQDDRGNDIAEEMKKLREEIAAQVKEWNRLRLGPLTKEAIDLRERFDDLVARARKFRMSTTDLAAAFDVAVDNFLDEALSEFERVPEIVASARDLGDRLADLDAALLALGAGPEAAARAATARATAVETFVDETLSEFERLGESSLHRELADLVRHFDEIREAFEEVGASADQMARLEAARAAALEDFWKRATEGIRAFIDELRAQDPRVSSERRFLDSREEFRDLVARAQGGDLEAVEQLEEAARAYREQALAFLGGGVGSNAVLDEILASLEGIAGVDPDAAEENPVVGRLDESNELLAQIRDVMTAWMPADRSSNPAAGEANEGVASRGDAGRARSSSPATSEAATTVAHYGDESGEGQTSPELVAALRRLADQDKRRAEAEAKERSTRRVEKVKDDQAREELHAILGKLAESLSSLDRTLKKQQPPAGG